MKTAALSIFVALSLVWIGLLPNIEALSPPQDAYLGGNAAETQNPLDGLVVAYNFNEGSGTTVSGCLWSWDHW